MTLLPDNSDLSNSLTSFTTASTPPIIQPSDTKLAALADTTAETLSGSELVTNGRDWTGAIGNTPPTGWDKAGSLTQYTITAGGALEIDRNGEGATNTTQTISTVAGQRYQLSLDYVATSQANTSVLVRVTGTAELFFETIQELTTHIVDFVADSSSVTIGIRPASAIDQVVEIDNVSVRLADPDRSVKGKGIGVHGSITKAPVATGADVVAYSGFSASNYLEQPYNGDLNFGAGDFSVMGWVKTTDTSAGLLERAAVGSTANRFAIDIATSFRFYTDTVSAAVATSGIAPSGVWQFICGVRSSAAVQIYVDGQLKATNATAAQSISNASAVVRLGEKASATSPLNGSLALWRISATAPTADQIRKIYEDERPLFQPNAKATLTGSSNAVTALSHDPDTNLLHVGTSGGRSVFQGLRRVEEHTGTNSQSLAAISAVDGLVVEGK